MKIIKEHMKHILRNLGIRHTRLLDYSQKAKLRESYYHKKILWGQDGHDLLAELIDNNKPIMVSRLGAVEGRSIRHFLKRKSGRGINYSRLIRHQISNNAGVFPSTNAVLDKFSEMYLEGMKNADILGITFFDHEDFFCNNYCKNAELVELGSIEPFRFDNPWSEKLKGKKILVVHPFVESIKKQYSEKRQHLFEDSRILPEFELKTVKAIQSIAESKVNFETWMDACNYMCEQIKKVDFDIAIIGAGAYGVPLASFIKQLGKKAIHMGGVTQILFGVKGRRWETEYAETTAKLFNEHWIRPSLSETPKGYNKVEKGCYW